MRIPEITSNRRIALIFGLLLFASLTLTSAAKAGGGTVLGIKSGLNLSKAWIYEEGLSERTLNGFAVGVSCDHGFSSYDNLSVLAEVWYSQKDTELVYRRGEMIYVLPIVVHL